MMTAPSTMRPKSSAPRLIRLALILPCSMPAAVSSMAIGITSAVISAARKLPSSRKQHDDDQQSAFGEIRGSPSARWRRPARCGSSTVLASMPGGSVRLISCILASTAAATVRLLPPISIRAVPTTTSCAVSLALPVRSSRADRRPRRHPCTRTGTPPRVATTTSPISLHVFEAPGGAHHIGLRRCARCNRRRG